MYWNPPLNDGGKPVKGYIVDIREIGAEKWNQYVSPLNTISLGNCLTVSIFLPSVLQYPTVPIGNFDWPCRFTRTLLCYVRLMAWAVRLSSVCRLSVTLLHWTFIDFSAIFLHRHSLETWAVYVNFWGKNRRSSRGSWKLNTTVWWKIGVFSTNSSLYFGNGIRYAHSYNEDE